jgi:hypothetical protein
MTEHAGQNATFDFDGGFIAGDIRSRRARERIRAWARLHHAELAAKLGENEGRPVARIHRAIVRGVRMRFLPSVVRAEHRGEFRLRIVFNDGSENTIDFSQWFEGPIFEPLKAAPFFLRYFIDGGTVTWPNGADIAPETLYSVPGRRQRDRSLQPGKASRTKTMARTRARVRG